MRGGDIFMRRFADVRRKFSDLNMLESKKYPEQKGEKDRLIMLSLSKNGEDPS
jgi:hypothetical protein